MDYWDTESAARRVADKAGADVAELCALVRDLRNFPDFPGNQNEPEADYSPAEQREWCAKRKALDERIDALLTKHTPTL